MKGKHLFALVGVIGLLYSCSVGIPPRILVTEVTPGKWGEWAPADVWYENTDTLGRKKLDILVRFRNDFACDRFDVVLETLTPDSLVWRDTLSVPFEKKEFIEAVSLTYTDVKTPYRNPAQLLRPGPYRFRFTPAPAALCVGEVIGVGIEITQP